MKPPLFALVLAAPATPLLALVGLSCTGLVACSHTYPLRPEVIPVRRVASASGAPKILRVVDIGQQVLPGLGILGPPQSDGQATVGELLVVWGESFGKQPTVSIGATAVPVLAHLAGGGLVVRVPPATVAGDAIKLQVQSRGGIDSFPLRTRRVGLVSNGRGLVGFTLGARTTLQALPGIQLGAVEGLMVDSSGACAYALVGGARGAALHTIDLSATPPRIVTHDPLPGRVIQAFAAARSAPRAIVATDTHLVVFDTNHPCTPIAYKPRPLERELSGKALRAAALSPGGQLLALVTKARNTLVLLDLQRPGAIPSADAIEVLPEARSSQLAGVTFSLEGKRLWLIASDTASSVAAGHRPIELLRYSVVGDTALRPPQQWEANAKGAVVGWQLDRSSPARSGAVIGADDSRSALYLAVQPAAQLQHQSTNAKGALLRVSPGRRAKSVLQLAGVEAIAVVSRPAIALVVCSRGNGKTASDKSLVVVARRAWDKTATEQSVDLGPALPLRQPGGARPFCVQP